MIYLDTSYLTKIYIDEPGSAAVKAWMTGQHNFTVAEHGRLELVSSLKRNERQGVITARNLKEILDLHEDDRATGLIRYLPITSDLITAACTRVAALSPKIFLRAADALHLAAARDAGLKKIYSHDRHLLAAAKHFGLKGIDVIPGPA